MSGEKNTPISLPISISKIESDAVTFIRTDREEETEMERRQREVERQREKEL